MPFQPTSKVYSSFVPQYWDDEGLEYVRLKDGGALDQEYAQDCEESGDLRDGEELFDVRVPVSLTKRANSVALPRQGDTVRLFLEPQPEPEQEQESEGRILAFTGQVEEMLLVGKGNSFRSKTNAIGRVLLSSLSRR